MKRLFVLALALLTCACASNRHTAPAPVFTAPSSQAVRSSVAKTRSDVAEAKTSAERAKAALQSAFVTIESLGSAPTLETVRTLKLQLEEAETQIDQLTQKLLEADTNAAAAEGHITELDAKVFEQTTALNDFADRNNKLTATNAKLTEERDRWRTIAIHWRVIAGAVVSAVAIYLFRKPLFGALKALLGLLKFAV